MSEYYRGSRIKTEKVKLPPGKITYEYIMPDGKIVKLTALCGESTLWSKISDDSDSWELIGPSKLAAGLDIEFKRTSDGILYRAEIKHV